jgi:hypothetical protein
MTESIVSPRDARSAPTPDAARPHRTAGSLSSTRNIGLATVILWLVIWLLAIGQAAAGVIDSPECRRDLILADQLVHAVRLRENSVQPGDYVGLCRLLRQNLQDMTRAREPMARCMSGHERGENVGQMDASIGDIQFILARHCVGR